MFRLRTPTAAAALGLALLAAAAAAAEPPKAPSDQEAAMRALQHGEVLPLSRILTMAAAKAPGDVIKVKLERRHGRLVYELKVLAADGRVREVHMDAATGALVDIEVE